MAVQLLEFCGARFYNSLTNVNLSNLTRFLNTAQKVDYGEMLFGRPQTPQTPAFLSQLISQNRRFLCLVVVRRKNSEIRYKVYSEPYSALPRFDHIMSLVAACTIEHALSFETNGMV